MWLERVLRILENLYVHPILRETGPALWSDIRLAPATKQGFTELPLQVRIYVLQWLGGFTLWAPYLTPLT